MWTWLSWFLNPNVKTALGFPFSEFFTYPIETNALTNLSASALLERLTDLPLIIAISTALPVSCLVPLSWPETAVVISTLTPAAFAAVWISCKRATLIVSFEGVLLPTA